MAASPLSLINPEWPVPPQIKAVSTTRQGGSSPATWDSFNLGVNTQDLAANIVTNRSLFAAELPAGLKIQWLKQVHGIEAFRADHSTLDSTLDSPSFCAPNSGGHSDPDLDSDTGLQFSSENLPAADICYSREKGLACAVLTADCLPILICDRQGSEIAAVHAGWRGLVKGVLPEALSKFSAAPKDLVVWIGPGISLRYFEVGGEVVDAMFDANLLTEPRLASLSRPSLKDKNKQYLDLPGIAKHQLAALGVDKVFGGSLCTYADPDRFFSYRRDGETGRMASLIWIE